MKEKDFFSPECMREKIKAISEFGAYVRKKKTKREHINLTESPGFRL